MSQFRQFERPRFFAGQLLTHDDLQALEDYLRDKIRLHNRFVHGWGIVTGLGVKVDRRATVVVSPGLALDCAGNELVLPEPQRLPLAGLAGRNYVTIRYLEVPTGLCPSAEGEPESNRVREGVQVDLASARPSAGHGRLSPGSPCCGRAHAIRLATIEQHGTQWRVALARRSSIYRE